MLNWFRYLKVDLRRWPNIAAYHKAHLARPSVARAIAEEMAEREKRAA
jgi:glutathione S-transferase